MTEDYTTDPPLPPTPEELLSEKVDRYREEWQAEIQRIERLIGMDRSKAEDTRRRLDRRIDCVEAEHKNRVDKHNEKLDELDRAVKFFSVNDAEQDQILDNHNKRLDATSKALGNQGAQLSVHKLRQADEVQRVHGVTLTRGQGEPDPHKADNWPTRRGSHVCATCVWYVVKAVEPGLGRCRRRAPTLSGYPVVYPSDWCGDHKLTKVL